MVKVSKTSTLLNNNNVDTGDMPACRHSEYIISNLHTMITRNTLCILAILCSSICMGKTRLEGANIKQNKISDDICFQLFGEARDAFKVTVPLVTEQEIREEQKETYEILLAELTTDYPWDADSIVVSTPEDGRLGALNLTAKTAIIDVLYNYDYKILDNLGHISEAANYGYLQAVPSFTLTFHHGGQNMHADFYQHNALREDLYASDESLYNISFNSCIYWNECKESFRKVKNVIEQSFNKSLAERKYEGMKPNYMLSQQY